MTHKTLTTEANIKRIQQLMRQYQPTSKLYQSMAPQLQVLIAQFQAEQQEAARLKALEAERQKAKAAAQAKAKAEAEEKARQAQLAADKIKAEAKAKAEKDARQAESAGVITICGVWRRG